MPPASAGRSTSIENALLDVEDLVPSFATSASHCAAHSRIELTNHEGIVVFDAPARRRGSDRYIDDFVLAFSPDEIDSEFDMILFVTTVALLAESVTFRQNSFVAQLIARRGRMGTPARWVFDVTNESGWALT
jgi:hypothetical protein